MINWWWFVIALLLGAALFWAGYEIRDIMKPVSGQELSALMTRLVNTEEVDEAARVRRAKMQRSGRRTIRADGGEPARVHRMRRRKVQNRPYE